MQHTHKSSEKLNLALFFFYDSVSIAIIVPVLHSMTQIEFLAPFIVPPEVADQKIYTYLDV